MYLIALNKVVAVVDVIKISLVQTFYNTFFRLTPFSLMFENKVSRLLALVPLFVK